MHVTGNFHNNKIDTFSPLTNIIPYSLLTSIYLTLFWDQYLYISHICAALWNICWWPSPQPCQPCCVLNLPCHRGFMLKSAYILHSWVPHIEDSLNAWLMNYQFYQWENNFNRDILQKRQRDQNFCLSLEARKKKRHKNMVRNG